MRLKLLLSLIVVQSCFARALAADEANVLSDFEQRHQGWVKYGHFFGPRYGELLKYSVVRESSNHFKTPDGFTGGFSMPDGFTGWAYEDTF